MRLDIEQFAMGVDSMLKSAQLGGGFMSSHTQGENILPYLENQRKWRYARHPEGIRLSDGSHVWSFDMPAEFGAETGRATRGVDPSILDWETGANERGTAQVHRSSPDSIYLTLHNGRENPTFHLEHMEGRNWKYIPGKKLRERLLRESAGNTVEVDPASLIAGAEKAAADLGLGANDVNNMLWKGIGMVKGHPLLAAGALVGGGLLAHRLLRKPRPPQVSHYTQPDPYSLPPQF